MWRREFIMLIVGAAAWPFLVHAQQPKEMRRIGMLLPAPKDDPDYQPWVGAFLTALQELGWSHGRNVQVDIHWATANRAEIRKEAAELAALAPDVILAPGTSTVGRRLLATPIQPPDVPSSASFRP